MKIRKCELCKKDINPETSYIKIKRNILFKHVDGQEDNSVWYGLFSAFICEDCVTKMQEYCSLDARGRA